MRLVIIGGSDAGIAGALRARELDPSCDVTVVLDDAYPNFSICGIPYYLSGEVVDWSKLAHRTLEELSSYGIAIRMNTRALAIDRSRHQLLCRTPDGGSQEISWDRLIIATGATPVIPTIEGLSAGLQTDRVFLVHTIADARALMSALSSVQVTRALIIGAGYIGLELAEALTTRGVTVAQFEAREHLLATIDPTLAGQLEAELAIKGVELVTGTRVSSLTANDDVT
ncbi:NAD(P)/FAD-dependent oxidoreductase, partial [Ferrimicrobium acidiphilum]